MPIWPTTPADPAVGDAATAAFADAVVQSLRVFSSASTAYTPVWTGATTNPVLGNGTITGNWIQFGKFVLYRIHLTMGTTTTYGTGAWIFTLPTATNFPTLAQIGLTLSSQGSVLPAAARVAAPTTINIYGTAGTAYAAAVPAAWASGQALSVNGWYETP